jgi:hypothetical protein
VLMRSSNRSPFGDCDSSVLETCADYLTQLAAVSNRDSLRDPSFAFDGVRTPPEESVNSASPNLRPVQRSRGNQPAPTFPRSPGIILKRSVPILFSTAANYIIKAG